MNKLILFFHNNPNAPQGLSNPLGLTLDTQVDAVHGISVEQQEYQFQYLGKKSIQELLEQFNSAIEQNTLKCFAVIPGELSTNHTLQVPTKSLRQIQKALPFLLEDQIASNPEDCFIALGEQLANNLSCALIDKSVLSGIKSFFDDNALACERLVSINSLILNEEQGLHVFSDSMLLKLNGNASYAFSADLLEIYLSKLVPETTKDALEVSLAEKDELEDNELEKDDEGFLKPELPVVIYDDTEEGVLEKRTQTIIKQFSTKNDFPFQLIISHETSEKFYLEKAELLSQRKIDKKFINFFQGEYKAKNLPGNNLFNLKLNWKPLAYLTSALLILSLLSVYIDTRRYQQGAELAEEQSKQLFREIFPNTKNYTRMKSRVEALVKGGSPTDNQFLLLMVAFSKGLESVNQNNPNHLKTTRFQYELKPSELKIDVLAVNFDVLNELKSLLEEEGFQLDITSTSSEQDSVKGRLLLTMP